MARAVQNAIHNQMLFQRSTTSCPMAIRKLLATSSDVGAL